MKMKKLKLFTIVLITLVFSPWVIKQFIPVLKIDGYSGLLWQSITTENTAYAPGYTHDKFLQIKVGMTESAVIKILGEPLTRWKPYKNSENEEKQTYVGLQYSNSPTDTHYRLRQIYVHKGIVKEVIGYYYLD